MCKAGLLALRLRVGCEASDARDRTPREAWGDIETLASVFVLHDTPKFVALGVEYAISY